MGFNYVVLRIPISGDLHRDIPIIYPDFLVHSDIAEAVRKITDLENMCIVSAGSIVLDALSCAGKSTTLNTTSRGALDAALVNQYPYFHGLVDIPEQ